MNLFINEFSIISPTEQKAFNEKFNNNINLVVGEKDSGKSSLARSMLYTLGCDVRSFDFTTKMAENIYIMDFNIDNNNYVLVRRKLKNGKGKNFYKVRKNNLQVSNFYKTKDFKDFLNKIMNIEVITTDKENQETKLYPNHIFLPFFTDQDYSWQNYLVSTFNGIQFIKNYRKIILEYFTGARSNEYYNLQLEKNRLKNLISELGALIKSKELIIEENNKNIKIIENIDVDKFQQQYKYVLEIYNNIIETEHKLKKELNEKIYKKNSLMEMQTKLNLSIKEIIGGEIDNYCPNCKQKIYNNMEESYKLISTQQNLIKEREKINMYLEEIQDEINSSMSEIRNIKNENNELRSKLNSDSKVIELSDRANSYALSHVNEKLLNEISDLRVKRDENEDNLKDVEKNLSNLNKNDVAKVYRGLMIQAFEDLNIPFAYKNYYVSNLESVNIMLSGATKVQAYIAQYLSIYEMTVNCNNTINIPMFIDTFLKDDFNNAEIERTSKFIFNSLKDKHQSFIFISNNKQTIDSISNFKFKEIKLTTGDKILNKDYSLIYDKYSELLKEN